MRVLTMNILGAGGGWAQRRPVLAAGLRALAPDIVALQEAVRTPADDQVVDLLGPDHHVFHQMGTVRRRRRRLRRQPLAVRGDRGGRPARRLRR
ncbi:MAG TPA: hypothetical protein VK891_01220 [Euzebyales bacterium]|nr:hypothetical protein [Euzebyales bacterium]